MREIVTVTGKITADQIGFCQFHEHLLVSKGKSYEINPDIYMDEVEKSAAEAAIFKKAGGRTIIDAQPGGCNRMAAGLAEISKKTGVNIICSTGFHKLMFYPEGHWIFDMPEADLAGFFARELTIGVSDQCDTKLPGKSKSQRAGIIKCALDRENLTPRYEKLFRAAAKAAIATERTMMVHIEKGSDPLLLLDFLLSLGMNPKHLVFCHLDRAVADLEIHKAVAERGVFLEFDTIGRFKYHSDEYEIELMKDLIRAGYGDRLLFSLDTTRARLKAYCPEAVGLDYILNVFIGKMKEAGITDSQIEKISNQNCIRALAE